MLPSDDRTRRAVLELGGAGALGGLLLGSGAAAARLATDRGATRAVHAGYDLHAGGIHFHTGYSDGAPDTRPSHAYAAGREAGMAFMAVTEHSEWLPVPVEADEACLDPRSSRLPQDCVIDPTEDPDALRKWDAQAEQAAAASTGAYLALRGFEWSSQVQGHVLVLGSRNYATAVETGGATMHGFWEWFTRDPALNGGADGLAVFAHPEREPRTFEEFRYVPGAADRVVGVEAFNRDDSYLEAGLAAALDAGWRVGAVGSADHHGPDWTAPDRARTVFLVPEGDDWTRATVRRTLLARRFYATYNHDLALRVRADGTEMGGTVTGTPGESVTLRVAAADRGGQDAIEGIELYTSGATRVAAVALDAPADRATLEHAVTIPAAGVDWYVARVVGVDGTAGPDRGDAVGSPVWVAGDER